MQPLLIFRISSLYAVEYIDKRCIYTYLVTTTYFVVINNKKHHSVYNHQKPPVSKKGIGSFSLQLVDVDISA